MELVLIAASALLVTFVAVPFITRLMQRRGVLDIPNERSSHSVPVPRGGGIACALGLLAGGLTTQLSGISLVVPVLASAVLLGLVGLADDKWTLPAVPRLLLQILIGAAAGWLLGGVVLAGLGALVVPAAVNVVNFMDGINGITALTIGTWGVVTLLVGVVGESPPLAALGALGLGSALGFLPWNAPTARIFLGDVGSYALGALAGSTVLYAITQPVEWWLVAMPLCVYFADTGWALVKRVTRREKLTEAHREHVYQRIVDGFQSPHIVVSAVVAAVALVATIFVAIDLPFGALAAAVALGVYLALPCLMSSALMRQGVSGSK